jgi:ATP-dependent helicase/nuclease subunit B
MTLLLPTRRATRALQEAFLAAADGAAVLLPRVLPLAAAFDEWELLAGAVELGAGSRRVITSLERQLVLTTLIQRWASTAAAPGGAAGGVEAAARTPAQAARLARELARLMDLLELAGLDARKVASLVPDTHAEHWARTLAFLAIVTEFWPKHLRDNDLISPAAHRNGLIAAEARRLRSGSEAPVIVAGVTAADPAALALMATVARLPNGAIVLPGLDPWLDDQDFSAVLAHPQHPQHGLCRLLAALGIGRADVIALGAREGSAVRARSRFVSEAMRPAETTELWHRFAAGARRELDTALSGMRVLEAATAEEEAEAIALILRKAAHSPPATAALVTPDRTLARRVSVRLEAWGLRVEDAAGQRFTGTAQGVFLDLLAQMFVRPFEPVALAALLKHGLCRLRLDSEVLGSGMRALEIAALRAPYVGQGVESLEVALEQAWRQQRVRHPAARRLAAEDWRRARGVLRALASAFEPMLRLVSERASLAEFARAHVAVAEAVAATTEDAGGALWQGEAGEWAAQLFAALLDADQNLPTMAASDYPEFYRALVGEKRLRLPAPTHPRLFIWDPFEARLRQPDIAILGGLNEGTWPERADPGPWLNGRMRQELGLPDPEESVGHAAHDVTLLLGASRVYLTRAAKVEGAPTVPSRWLLRIKALAGSALGSGDGTPWLGWARARTAVSSGPRTVTAPEPRPPVSMRPRQLSVTAIEKWIANPYAIFAERLLGLEPLPPLGRQPDAALRGLVIHRSLAQFARAHPERLPEYVDRELVEFCTAALSELIGSVRVAAFWEPRFARFAQWFAQTEPRRRLGVTRTLAEVDGRMILEAPAGPFTLTARADRVDIAASGIIISDYKTAPDLAHLAAKSRSGAAPQLALEAAIARADGFALAAPVGTVLALRYISTAGGEPPGDEVEVAGEGVEEIAQRNLEGLRELIATFDQPETPYRALRRARFNYAFDAYTHLARVAEWWAEEGWEG